MKITVNNTEPKKSLQIILSGNKSQFKTRFNPPIQLDYEKNHEIALNNLEAYFSSFSKINETNNYFVYSLDNGKIGMISLFPKAVMMLQTLMISSIKT